jgi:hypothetical protein
MATPSKGKTENLVKESGVYKIKICGYEYYGGSIDIIARIKNHLSKLRRGVHRNKSLQECFDKYGESNFNYEIILICDKSQVLDYEQKYLDLNHHKEKCVNFSKNVKSIMKGLKFSKEHRHKISIAQQKNKYIFYYNDGQIKEFDSLFFCSDFFGVKKSIASKWFKGKYLRKNGLLVKSGVIKIERKGEKNCIVEFGKRQKIWQNGSASSKSDYYRKLRKEKEKSL